MSDPRVRERKIFANAMCLGICQVYGAGMGVLWILTDEVSFAIMTLFALGLAYGFELESRKL